MEFWNADVESNVQPDDLRPGDHATHSVTIENFDNERFEMSIASTCRGPHLRYGRAATWTATVLCDGRTRLQPAAATRVTLPSSIDHDSLPSVEQIELTVTLVLDTPLRESEELSRVYTLQLHRP